MNQLQERINRIFEEAKDQYEVLFAIYRLFIPEWETIKMVKGWPSAGQEISQYIWGKFMVYDKQRHPEVLAGGLWMNSGFSENKMLGEWQVDLSTCQIFH